MKRKKGIQFPHQLHIGNTIIIPAGAMKRELLKDKTIRCN
jgi:hypothetical protein